MTDATFRPADRPPRRVMAGITRP